VGILPNQIALRKKLRVSELCCGVENNLNVLKRLTNASRIFLFFRLSIQDLKLFEAVCKGYALLKNIHDPIAFAFSKIMVHPHIYVCMYINVRTYAYFSAITV